MSQTAEEMKKIARAPVEVKYGMPLLSNSNKDFLSQDLSKIISKDAMNICYKYLCTNLLFPSFA